MNLTYRGVTYQPPAPSVPMPQPKELRYRGQRYSTAEMTQHRIDCDWLQFLGLRYAH